MGIDEFLVRYPATVITPEQLACCRYLERQGQQLLMDFGYETAPEIVWHQLDREYAERNN